MNEDALPQIGPPALLRDGEGRLVALRALPNESLLALGRFLAEEEADFHLALVRDALAQGATEDEARALLDLDPEELRRRADASWAQVVSEITRRGLPRPGMPPPPRDLAEIEGLLRRTAEVGIPGVPASLEAALAARASLRASGGGALPLAWADLIRRHNGLRLGGLRLLAMEEACAAPPLVGWTVFAVSGRGTVFHAADVAGGCAAWRTDQIIEGIPSGMPGLSQPDLVSYLEALLPRALEAAQRRPG